MSSYEWIKEGGVLDSIYIKYGGEERDDKVECPRCGRWCGTHLAKQGVNRLLRFECCLYYLRTQADASLRWCIVATKDLLEMMQECPPIAGKTGYFLPHTWNTSSSWISHKDLKKKYDEYTKEKEK